MRYIAILTLVSLAGTAAASTTPQEVKPEEFKCDLGEAQTRRAYLSVTFRQEVVQDASNPHVLRPAKLSLSNLSVLYCHDGKKGGVEQERLESPIPLVKAFVVDVPAKAKWTAYTNGFGYRKNAYLGLRAKPLGTEPPPNAACGASDCRNYYHEGPPNEHYLQPLEQLFSDQCQALVKAYARGLAQGEVGKRLPGKKVGDFLDGHQFCQESFWGHPASGKLTFEVHVNATMPLTD